MPLSKHIHICGNCVRIIQRQGQRIKKREIKCIDIIIKCRDISTWRAQPGSQDTYKDRAEDIWNIIDIHWAEDIENIIDIHRAEDNENIIRVHWAEGIENIIDKICMFDQANISITVFWSGTWGG